MIEPIGTPPVCVEVVITAENPDWLAGFARSLVEDHVAACAHTASPVTVMCSRDGKVVDSRQARVSLHTRAGLVSEIVERTERDDPDAVPNVVALRIVDGSSDYLHWIVRETARAARGTVRAR